MKKILPQIKKVISIFTSMSEESVSMKQK